MPYKENYIKINLTFQIDNLELYVILEYKFTTINEFKLGFKTKKKKRKENINQKKKKNLKRCWAQSGALGPGCHFTTRARRSTPGGWSPLHSLSHARLGIAGPLSSRPGRSEPSSSPNSRNERRVSRYG
jgi:hypothetical protein